MKTIVLGALNAITDPGQINDKPSRLPQWLQPLEGEISTALMAVCFVFALRLKAPPRPAEEL